MKVAILGTWHVHTKEYTTGVLNNPNAEVAVVWDNDCRSTQTSTLYSATRALTAWSSVLRPATTRRS